LLGQLKEKREREQREKKRRRRLHRLRFRTNDGLIVRPAATKTGQERQLAPVVAGVAGDPIREERAREEKKKRRGEGREELTEEGERRETRAGNGERSA